MLELSIGDDGTHGGYGFGDRNADGSRILEFADGLNLVICNTNNITKEMIIGKPKSDNIPLLQIDGRQIERVCHFKILGLQLPVNLLWDRYVEYICKKISSKLYFLKLLKRAGLSSDDLQ